MGVALLLSFLCTGPGQATFGGVVLPKHKAKLAFADSGVIVAVPQVGQYVSKGQTVAAVDDVQSRTAIDQAQAGLDVAELELKSAVHNQEKTQRLFDQKIVSDIAITEGLFTVDRARAQQREAQARFEASKERWKRCFVRAPFSGVVVGVTGSLGEWASPGGAVAELVDLSALELSVDLPPEITRSLRTGLVTDILDGATMLGKATVRTVLPYIDPASGLVRVIWTVAAKGDSVAGRYVTLGPWVP